MVAIAKLWIVWRMLSRWSEVDGQVNVGGEDEGSWSSGEGSLGTEGQSALGFEAIAFVMDDMIQELRDDRWLSGLWWMKAGRIPAASAQL